jgi:hypothetical protein
MALRVALPALQPNCLFTRFFSLSFFPPDLSSIRCGLEAGTGNV